MTMSVQVIPTMGELWDGAVMPDVYCSACRVAGHSTKINGVLVCREGVEVITSAGESTVVCCDCEPCRRAYNREKAKQ